MLSVLPSLSIIDPQHAKNITVFHVNEHKFGAIPVNMDTADALGDMFFDMLEVIMYPLSCPNGTDTSFPKGFLNPCTNPEAEGADLRVNKVMLEVDGRYSGYAACNVGVNNSDPFGGSCKTDTYCCDCLTGSWLHPKKLPCNATLGYENLYKKFGVWLKGGCKRSILTPHPSNSDCYRANVFSMLNATSHGTWYSSLDKGYCGAQAEGALCTWRVLRAEVVKRECHLRVFGAEVARAAPLCFEGCGDQKTNTSSLCWVDCFFQVAGLLSSGLSRARVHAACASVHVHCMPYTLRVHAAHCIPSASAHVRRTLRAHDVHTACVLPLPGGARTPCGHAGGDGRRHVDGRAASRMAEAFPAGGGGRLPCAGGGDALVRAKAGDGRSDRAAITNESGRSTVCVHRGQGIGLSAQ